MCGSLLGGLFGGGQETPKVVYSSPRADAEKAEAEANAKAAQDKTRRRRLSSSSSLLATGGEGDALGSGSTPAASGNVSLGGR